MKKSLGGVAVCAVLLFLALYLYYGTKVPAGQPAVVPLTEANIEELRSSFNAVSDDVRIILLLSPT